MGAACCSRRQRAQPQAPDRQPLLQEQPLGAEAAWLHLVLRLQRAERVCLHWCRFEQQFRSLRKLQLTFAHVGHYLQQIDWRLRRRLARVYPKIHG